MQPPEPLERRSARGKARFCGLERLQKARSGDSGYCGGDTVGELQAPFGERTSVGVLSVNTCRKTTESRREGGPGGPMFPLLSVASARLRTSTETSHSRGRGFDSPRLHLRFLLVLRRRTSAPPIAPLAP